eukprot:TRINITY_DN65770_c0_g1_i1.p1 TRINITY_DN65770_c0_g1~~TRINITY_DN65770_c0_g1_i1.p1  ORF type:complete len:119 (-),score=4.42 TRINITY_DN65770_c0_g1_i1:2-358(-)
MASSGKCADKTVGWVHHDIESVHVSLLWSKIRRKSKRRSPFEVNTQLLVHMLDRNRVRKVAIHVFAFFGDVHSPGSSFRATLPTHAGTRGHCSLPCMLGWFMLKSNTATKHDTSMQTY